MSKEGRSILAMIARNFIQSLKPRQIKGNLTGSDYLGNKYYEIPANPSIGKRRPQRWFEPINKDDFEQEIPAEWEAWLRGRRKEPPEEQEVLKNLSIMHMKKKNAAELAAKLPQKNIAKLTKGMESYPRYEEYELLPGKDQAKAKK